VLEPGAHTLQARCTTRSGNKSDPPSEDSNLMDGYGGSGSITFNAT